MNYGRYIAWSCLALAVLVLYVALDQYVLKGLLSPYGFAGLVRAAGIIACSLAVSSLFFRRGLDDLRAQRQRAQRAEPGYGADGQTGTQSGAVQDQKRFVFRRRYVAAGWLATLVPVVAIALFWITDPGNLRNVVAMLFLLCWFVFGAVDRMRWSFLVTDAGFEWGGFIRTRRPFSEIKSIYVSNEYAKPILVFERKNTIRKDAFGAIQVDGFDVFCKVATVAWRRKAAI